MKKKLFFLISLVVMTVIGVFASKHQFNESKMFDDNCEALTSCEIVYSYVDKDTKKTVVVGQLTCTGEQDVCSETMTVGKLAAVYLGLPGPGDMTLSCSGTKVALEE
jgi:hypothetical protein